MLGIVFIGYDDFCTSFDLLWGDMLALLSGVLFAIYFLLGKKLRETTESLILMNMVYFSSAITCLGFVAWEKASISVFSSTTWMAFFAMAIIPTILGHFLFMYVSKFLKAGATSASTLLEPVFAGIIAYIAFNEKINLPGIVGYLSILIGMIFLFFSEPEEARQR